MEGILKVTPQQMISTANEFNTCGTTVRNLTQSMTSLVNGLSSVWSGEAASAYNAKFNGLQDDIERIHRMIQEHVTDLNEMAENYTAAENANLTEIEALASDVII